MLDDDAQAGCSYPGCIEFRFDEAAALREGWARVGEQLFCPFHGPGATRKERMALQEAAMDDRLRQFEAQGRDDEAKRVMTSREYEAWHNFQAEVRNFEREQQSLRRDRSFRACKAVRDLSPRGWLKHYRAGTPVNMRQVQESVDHAVNASREALLRRIGGV